MAREGSIGKMKLPFIQKVHTKALAKAEEGGPDIEESRHRLLLPPTSPSSSVLSNPFQKMYSEARWLLAKFLSINLFIVGP